MAHPDTADLAHQSRGALIEVPVMLSVVKIVNRSKS
jgi:ACR3 family arsenite efflux pump ArsB